MQPNPSDKRFQKRRRNQMVNSLFATFSYYIAFTTVFLGMKLNLLETTYSQLFNLFFAGTFTGVMYVSISHLNKRPSEKFDMIFFQMHFFTWTLMNIYFTYVMGEYRFLALISCFQALIFLILNGNIAMSMIMTAVIAISHLSVSYIAINFLNQKGNFSSNVLAVIFFLPGATFVAFMAEQFRKSRQSIRIARQNAEKHRDALWGEMELAKKIQTVLLPANPEITDYEIAASMIPADEVGGDFYDVINVDGKDWIAIGDVSGHGFSAGLVMMMVQTAIKTVLEANPDSAPSLVLKNINRVIRENIKRLNEDKYVTLTVLAVFDNGTFTFSGLHQDILIYRSEKGYVEIVETDGMWIGLVDEINDMVSDRHVKLDRDDVMIMYTDGITEAMEKKKGLDHTNEMMKIRMFGETRFLDIIKENGTKQPVDIINKVNNELSDYECNDDYTIFVIKRNK